MQQAGFVVERIQGAKGKREMLRAKKTSLRPVVVEKLRGKDRWFLSDRRRVVLGLQECVGEGEHCGVLAAHLDGGGFGDDRKVVSVRTERAETEGGRENQGQYGRHFHKFFRSRHLDHFSLIILIVVKFPVAVRWL